MSQPLPGTPAHECLARLRSHPIQPAGIASFFDALAPSERIEAVRAVGRSEQRRLYDAMKGVGEVRLVNLVGPGRADLETVRHYGRNTLPAFTHFEKRFCRPRGADRQRPHELHGFNFQTMSFVTGPGYFVARDAPGAPEVLIDYRSVPSEHPAGWPEIRSNDRGLGRLVYGNMIDTLRRVSEHVTVGSAARGGKDLGSWFLLCREG